MKRIDAFDSYFNYLGGEIAQACSEQLSEQIAKRCGAAVSRLQMFSCFIEPGVRYPFMKGTIAYYPLTVIYKNENWETLWVEWDTKNIPTKHSAFSPYVFDGAEIEIKICEEVDPCFWHQIQGKNLCHIRHNGDLRTVIEIINVIESPQQLGRFSAWFMEEMGKQINDRIEEKTGKRLDKHWQLSVNATEEMVTVDGVNYIKAQLQNFSAKRIDLCICWQESKCPSDYVAPGEIVFELSESAPNFQPCNFKELKDFVEKGNT